MLMIKVNKGESVEFPSREIFESVLRNMFSLYGEDAVRYDMASLSDFARSVCLLSWYDGDFAGSAFVGVVDSRDLASYMLGFVFGGGIDPVLDDYRSRAEADVWQVVADAR